MGAGAATKCLISDHNPRDPANPTPRVKFSVFSNYRSVFRGLFRLRCDRAMALQYGVTNQKKIDGLLIARAMEADKFGRGVRDNGGRDYTYDRWLSLLTDEEYDSLDIPENPSREQLVEMGLVQ